MAGWVQRSGECASCGIWASHAPAVAVTRSLKPSPDSEARGVPLDLSTKCVARFLAVWCRGHKVLRECVAVAQQKKDRLAARTCMSTLEDMLSHCRSRCGDGATKAPGDVAAKVLRQRHRGEKIGSDEERRVYKNL